MELRLPEPGVSFRSDAWLSYFRRNREERVPIALNDELAVEPGLRGPLIRSLQRFQVGESGDGTHLLAGAETTGDPDYVAAIRLFVAEEQEHARMLAIAVEGLGGKLIDGHWSDRAFVTVRRMMGLRTELLVLLIAELIARRYYRALYDGCHDPALRAMYAQIMRDEVGHVSFHIDYLRHAFAGSPGWARTLVHFWWTAAFRATCLVVLIDHGSVFRACGVSREAFWHDCGLIHSDASTRIFGNAEASAQFLFEGVRDSGD